MSTDWNKDKKDKTPRTNLVAQMAADIDTEREETQRDEETTNREGEDQSSAPATVTEADASVSTTKGKRTKLTDQGMTRLVITGSYKKHTMTVYEPLYQLMTTMAKAWNANIQDVAALVMMAGVRSLKDKERKDVDRLIKKFVSTDTDNEIADINAAFLRAQTAALLAQAGLTPDDLKALANGKS